MHSAGFETAVHMLRGTPGPVHLMGIGGIGMAGLAVLLAHRGFSVSGCDVEEGPLTQALTAQGVKVHIGHDRRHIEAQTAWVIRSTAVSADCDEWQYATVQQRGLSGRGEVLAAMVNASGGTAVAGSHGKTTTTAMLVHLLKEAGLALSYFVGGVTDDLASVAAGGPGHRLVVEADESDGTLFCYRPTTAVITNIDYDHLEHYTSEEHFLSVFEHLARSVGRRLIYNGDDVNARAVARFAESAISFGFQDHNDWVIRDVVFSGTASVFSLAGRSVAITDINVPVPGRHNVCNAAAACLAAHKAGVDAAFLRDGFRRFRPVKRRLECVVQHARCTVYTDYAHHPTEVRALVETLRLKHAGRLIALFQPHRYTRTRAMGTAFASAFEGVDELVLLPVYAASEAVLPGGRTEDILDAFTEGRGYRLWNAEHMDEAVEYVKATARPGDVLVIVGAGDVIAMTERVCAVYE